MDNGVIEHLLPTVVNSTEEWEVVNAIFGVDHVGHTHGPYHPSMSDKLDQLDKSLTSCSSRSTTTRS